MVQTRSSQPSAASESKPKTKTVKKKGAVNSTQSESKKKVNEPISENDAEAATTVPEKRKLDDEDEQPRPSKTAKEDDGATNGLQDEKSIEDRKETKEVEPTVAHKIAKIIDEYGTMPLEGLGVDKPLEPSPEILLAIVIDSMLKSTRISHNLAQQASMKVFEAGYYDIEVLSNTSWDDRVQVLSEGGYNRYRESTATKLGDLATLVNDKYDGDLNNLLAKAGNKPSQIRQLIREIKGFGDVATDLFCDDAQAIWSVLAPTIDHRSLSTAEEVGIGQDIGAIYAELGGDPVQMSKLARGLSAKESPMAATPETTPRKLWEHPDPESTQMGMFKSRLEKAKGIHLADYDALYQWSIQNRSEFWSRVWEELPLIHEGRYTSVLDESAPIQSNPDWFPGVRVNFAENILFSTPSYEAANAGVRSTVGKEDSKIAVHEAVESNLQPARDYTWKELRRKVGLYTQALKAAGIKGGDRVAVVSGNNINCLVLYLATTALGALVSTTSSDTGTKGILDRLAQIEPKLLFMDDAAVYKGKIVDLRAKIAEIVQGMHAVAEFKGVVSLPRLHEQPMDIASVPRTELLEDFLSKASSDKLEFVRVGFRDPFLIVYSSGTTGQPKCIVHSTGGVLISMVKEAKLHRDMDPQSALLQYTTTGWIMYLTSFGSLLGGSKIVIYDGSPFAPDAGFLIRLASEQRVTHFGISPRYLQELRKQNIQPRKIADLSNLRNVSSTGMVLADSLFEWFYDEGFPAHAQIGNISGGTDLAACFTIDNPLSPLYVGGCQAAGLGMPIAVYEQVDEGLQGVDGKAVADGEAGELVAVSAFPSMPVTFWGKDGPKKYYAAYFEKYNNVWTHGDFITIHPLTKQVIFSGRSDGVLNPSGIRFGSAEIYNVLETQFASEVVESICVGQRRPQDLDESVILFVQMQPRTEFTDGLVQRIRDAIRKLLSPRHVPKYIFETPEIPTTVNGKKVELPVKQIVSGKRIKPSGTLANPQSLEYFYQFSEIEKVGKVRAKL
ncbi:hypothetical protein UA08_06489 [Talaromyces atroroseus]|uniref:AMP-dependent synthetase/ligase domain-containing protein n=1 Tax=Talaromyces atroroseus TaxID=1441469 RepID=A0A225AAY7_TALAT|nr:hypothetical protein UA08_06489 [Talaromyces atroroseus]OKL58072.1 hypothetical protein UA08_06489 [Talaromyces atroroseus]